MTLFEQVQLYYIEKNARQARFEALVDSELIQRIEDSLYEDTIAPEQNTKDNEATHEGGDVWPPIYESL